MPAYAARMNLPASPPSGDNAPVVLDMEASGFGRDSYPIEVGCVMPDGKAFCTLISPAPGWEHWDPAAEKVHHISLESVRRHGKPAREVALMLNERLHGLTAYSDGWANDYSWLGALFEAAGLSPAFRLENLRALLSEREANHWHIVKQQVAREMRLQRHRASADARVLQATLLRLRMPLPG